MRSADGDMAIFEWLTKDFECPTMKLRKLIKKKNAMMGKADFTRHRNRSSTN